MSVPYTKPCPECEGRGFTRTDVDGQRESDKCSWCHGGGVVPDPDDLPGDFGPAYPEPECWGETSYEHYRGECRHFQRATCDECRDLWPCVDADKPHHRSRQAEWEALR